MSAPLFKPLLNPWFLIIPDGRNWRASNITVKFKILTNNCPFTASFQADIRMTGKLIGCQIGPRYIFEFIRRMALCSCVQLSQNDKITEFSQITVTNPRIMMQADELKTKPDMKSYKIII